MGTDAHCRKRQTDRKAAKRPALWMRLSVALISPVVFLLLIEIILTLIGYGLPKDFFVPYDRTEPSFYISNRDYCRHFVPKELSRAPEATVLGGKNSGTVRIFVLGGSAAFGDPDPAFGFCRQLQVLLNEYASDTSFEVINAAVTSMNSHVAKRIAEDCVPHKPDVFIIFMGNNEVVGPYGPPTLPGWLYNSDAFINASITVKKETRLGQFVDRSIQSLRTSGKPAKRWQGMEAFLASQISRDDPTLQSCYHHFQTNLNAIIDTAQSCGAKTILCTVPTNITASAPFGSAHASGLSKDKLAAWEQHFQAGREHQKSGQYETALLEYAKAKEIDSGYADLSFCTGTCLLALDQSDQAKQAYIEARDLDTLRFRADSSIERNIHKVANASEKQGVTLLDLDTILSTSTEEGLLGDNLLVDHVHLNFRGNVLAARAAMDTLSKVLPEAGLNSPSIGEDELRHLLRQRLLFDDHEMYSLAMTMYRRKTLPPFSGQIDHGAEMKRFRQSLFAVYGIVKNAVPKEEAFADVLQSAPYDSYLTIRYGQFLLGQGQLSAAVQLYQKVLKACPADMKIRVALAKALALGGMRDKAIEALMASESPYPYDRKGALLALGVHYVQSGRLADAGQVYRELETLDPDNPDVWINLAAAASYSGDIEAMKRYLDKALALAPNSIPVMVNMGNYYAKKNEPAQAQTWFDKAVKADPQDHTAQIGLGIQSIRLNQIQKGLTHITEAVQLKPDLVEGYQVLAAVYQELGQEKKAKEYANLRDLFQTTSSQ